MPSRASSGQAIPASKSKMPAPDQDALHVHAILKRGGGEVDLPGQDGPGVRRYAKSLSIRRKAVLEPLGGRSIADD